MYIIKRYALGFIHRLRGYTVQSKQGGVVCVCKREEDALLLARLLNRHMDNPQF